MLMCVPVLNQHSPTTYIYMHYWNSGEWKENEKITYQMNSSCVSEQNPEFICKKGILYYLLLVEFHASDNGGVNRGDEEATQI